MVKHKLYEATSDVTLEDIEDILVGTFCYGDDGEDSYIRDVFEKEDGCYISFVQNDGCEYEFPLIDYIDNIPLEPEDKAVVMDYLGIDLTESLNESRVAKGPSLVSITLNSDDSEAIHNLVVWSRELLNLIKYPIPETEFIYIKDGLVHYRINNIGLNAGTIKKLEVKIARYVSNTNFPAGLELNIERAEFTIPFDLTGTINLNLKNI